jgi:hypothetical protein
LFGASFLYARTPQESDKPIDFEPHHTPSFWLRVERAMPDYAQRKAWLAEHGMDVEGI